jgi:hypothetical protein
MLILVTETAQRENKSRTGSITASNHDPQKKLKIHRGERPKRIRAKRNNEEEEGKEVHIHHYT